MSYRSSTEEGYGIGAPTDHVDASPADRIDIPDAELLFRGHFARSGPDLILTGEDSHRLVVTGYFATEKRALSTAVTGGFMNRSPPLLRTSGRRGLQVRPALQE